MHRPKSLPRILAGLILSMLLFLGVRASSEPNDVTEGTFAQTTTPDWSQGTGLNVDIRTLDSLHSPYGWDSDARGSVRLASRPGTWTRQSVAGPVVGRGGDGEWDEKNVAEAAVLYNDNDDQYMMWYSGQNANDQWQVGLTTSSDGLNWNKYGENPVLGLGSPGDWDDQEVSFSFVLNDGGNYHTWFSGYDGSTRRIGYAFSVNGINWLKIDNPVLSGTVGAWDETLVGNPTVAYDGTTYHMWYGGWNSTANHWRIGHATSPDRVTWTKDPSNPVLDPGLEGSWDDTHVTAPTVYFDGYTFHMWYGGWGDQDYGEHSPGRIGYATSTDGTLWLKASGNPVYGPSALGNWDSMWTVDPEVLFDGDLYHLWYTGGVTWTGLQIGYAIAEPIYESSGAYTSTLVDSACITGELVFWENLHLKQELKGQPLTYAILNESGQTIPGFEALSSPDAEANLSLSSLPGFYDRIYLQASFSAADPKRSAVLQEWDVSWSCQQMPYRAFLPLIMKK